MTGQDASTDIAATDVYALVAELARDRYPVAGQPS